VEERDLFREDKYSQLKNCRVNCLDRTELALARIASGIYSAGETRQPNALFWQSRVHLPSAKGHNIQIRSWLGAGSAYDGAGNRRSDCFDRRSSR
jgi:hypothetical protein